MSLAPRALYAGGRLCGMADEWIDEAPEKPVRRRRGIIHEPDPHGNIPVARRGPIGAEKPVPERKAEAEILMMLVGIHRMMHAVHVGCHDEAPQQLVRALAKPQLGVIENRRGIEKNLKQDDGGYRRAKKRDGGHLDSHADESFERMETDACCCIDMGVGVMNTVHSPEQAGFVKENMLPINEKVQGEQGEKEGKRIRHADPMKQSETMPLRRERHAGRKKRHGDP